MASPDAFDDASSCSPSTAAAVTSPGVATLGWLKSIATVSLFKAASWSFSRSNTFCLASASAWETFEICFGALGLFP